LSAAQYRKPDASKYKGPNIQIQGTTFCLAINIITCTVQVDLKLQNDLPPQLIKMSLNDPMGGTGTGCELGGKANGAAVGNFAIGGRTGLATGTAKGVAAGAKVGAGGDGTVGGVGNLDIPYRNTSIALICGSLIPATKSRVMKPSLTTAFIDTIYGTFFPGASRNISRLSMTSNPSA
jgi:hypothetical protein